MNVFNTKYNSLEEAVKHIFGNDIEICPLDEEPRDFNFRLLCKINNEFVIIEPYFDEYNFQEYSDNMNQKIDNIKLSLGWSENDYDIYILHFSKQNIDVEQNKIPKAKFFKFQISGYENWVINELPKDPSKKRNYDNLAESNITEQLIKNIYKILEDYRLDENNPEVQMSEDRIRNWIIQFDEPLRIPILKELKNIFEKRYCSKNKVKILLEKVVIKLTEDFSFQTPQDFLRNSIFLNLQPEGKSQRIMLNLFDELISDKYGISLENCGTMSIRYSIYIDDILCTGLTLFNDIKEWSGQNFSLGKTNLQAINDDSTTLVFVYVFIHNKNYHKKIAEMRHKISNEISLKHKMYRHIEIENEIGIFSKMDLVLPLESGETQSVINYKDSITNEVDNYTQRYNRISPNEFYRPTGLPSNETFFTDSENRKLVEDAFLLKGIEILNKANSISKNIRALGYSIPSLKNFGFGALCFTWRNIPNNAPLIFWYSGGGFFPLFKVTRGSTTFVDLTLLDNQTQTQNEDLPF